MPEEATPQGSGSDNSAAAAAPTSTPSTSALGALQKAASAASSAATPADASPVGQDANAGATAQPGRTVQPAQPGANAGAQGGEDQAWLQIPEPRRNTILENTRTKVREEVTAEIMRDLGWAKGVDRGSVQTAFTLAQNLSTAPVRFALELIRDIMGHPQLAPQFEREFQALMPGSPIPGQKPVAKEWPKAILRSDDGRGAYTDEQLREILDIEREQWMSALEERFGPLEDMHSSLEEQREVTQIMHQSRQDSANFMTELRQLKHWPSGTPEQIRAGERKISGYLAAIPKEVKDNVGAVAATYQAFQTYLANDVYPTLESSVEQRVRDDMKRKAAAGTGAVVPGQQTNQPAPKKPTNQSELSAHLESLFTAAQRG
jgi:hypothetical protein